MASTEMIKPVPRRRYGTNNSRLPESLPIIGLGCSSFSTFFWTPEELSKEKGNDWTPEGMDRTHPRVREWIAAIKYAVEVCGVTLLDTAPWYGHGTSEVVIGWAMEEMIQASSIDREQLIINTKVGRYEADPKKQFDFSYSATVASVKRSIERMNCKYVDVLQLHDPEFAPTLDVLLKETVPAMLECRQKGYCKALGITGFPLETQFQIINKSLEIDPKSERILDQSLTYGHYNLANTNLLDKRIDDYSSFGAFCRIKEIGLMAAAPLAMGLFTKNAIPDWHPADDQLKEAAKRAVSICDEIGGIDIIALAILFALSNPLISCTVLGMRNVEEVAFCHAIVSPFHGLDNDLSQEEILKKVLTDSEYKALTKIRDPKNGPFAEVWKSGLYTWDGIDEAKKFWNNVEGVEQVDWHLRI